MRCIDSSNKLTVDINITNRNDNINNPHKDIDLHKYSRQVLKDQLTKHILFSYDE